MKIDGMKFSLFSKIVLFGNWTKSWKLSSSFVYKLLSFWSFMKLQIIHQNIHLKPNIFIFSSYFLVFRIDYKSISSKYL